MRALSDSIDSYLQSQPVFSQPILIADMYVSSVIPPRLAVGRRPIKILILRRLKFVAFHQHALVSCQHVLTSVHQIVHLPRDWEREGRAVLFGDPRNGDDRFFCARGLSGGSREDPRLPLNPTVNHRGPSTTHAFAIAALMPAAPATGSTFSDLPGLGQPCQPVSWVYRARLQESRRLLQRRQPLRAPSGANGIQQQVKTLWHSGLRWRQ